MRGRKVLRGEGGFVISPIGVVRVSCEDEDVKTSFDGVRGGIEVYEEFSQGLEGIDGFSHLILVAYMNKVKGEGRSTLMVKPRRFIRLGVDPVIIPTVGVFSTHSPDRPNPIAITVVRLLRREGRRLYVDGLDLFDSTPIIDIRPYTKEEVAGLSYQRWYTELQERTRLARGR